MKNILVTGSLAFDHIMDFPGTFEEHILPHKLKTLSVSFHLQNLNKNFGGVSGNIAYNLALLGQNPIILASSGKKDFRIYNKHLQKFAVNTKFVNQVKNEFTANVFLITDRNNCQIAGFYAGASTKDSHLKIGPITRVQKIDFLVVGPTLPSAMNNFVLEAKKLDIPYLYDPAQQTAQVKKDELINGISHAEILICNDYELALVTKKTGLTKKKILKKVKILITTLGKKGSLIETENHTSTIRIVKPKRVIDPTGAGDAYIAGFLTANLNGYQLKTCGQAGATLATYAIENYGTQKHKFTIEQFKERYKETFGENLNI